MNQLATRKNVLIDEHPYSVRRFGNIEQLSMSQFNRRIEQLVKLEKVKSEDKNLVEIEDIAVKIADMFVGLFDDGGDQSKSRALVSSMTYEEISLLLKQVFDTPEIKQEADETKKD